MDVDTAFLYGNLDEEIYSEGLSTNGKVLKLKKSLYGLKQASRNWNSTIDNYLKSNGFKRSMVDNCLYSRVNGDSFELILVYVDDLLIVASNLNRINDIKIIMKERFRMKDLGELSMFVGMEIDIKREQQKILITQNRYAERILKEFNMSESKVSTTPMESNSKLKDAASVNENELFDCEYRKLVGSLLYLSTHTRPDIAEAVGCLSRNLERPTKEHWDAGMKVLRYLKGTINYGINFQGKNMKLEGYSDASWASTPDMKSISGYVFMFNNAPISWRSKKQTVVALSSTESEYVALAECIKEAIWLKKLFIELDIMKVNEPVLIFEDNQSCIKISKNDSNHGRMKHVNIKYHFIREQVESGEVKIQYCKTENMKADMFTKSLAKSQFECLRKQIGIEPNSLLHSKINDSERVLKGINTLKATCSDNDKQ